jgi:hypothetical protein
MAHDVPIIARTVGAAVESLKEGLNDTTAKAQRS